MKEKKLQKGSVIVYLSMVIMAILLAMSFTLHTMTINRLKITREIGNSSIAFLACDVVTERELKNPYQIPSEDQYYDYEYYEYYDFVDLNGNGTQDENDALCTIKVVNPGVKIEETKDICPSDVNNCIFSTCIYKGNQRRLLIAR